MIKNLREMIMNRIANIICDSEYMVQIDMTGKRPVLEELDVLNKLLSNTTRDDLVDVKIEEDYTGRAFTYEDNKKEDVNSACSTCSNYLRSKATGGALICNCTLASPTITCYNGYQSNIG